MTDFIEDLPEELAQPIDIEGHVYFVVVEQWDGTGEMQHCVIVANDDVDDFVRRIQEAKK